MTQEMSDARLQAVLELPPARPAVEVGDRALDDHVEPLVELLDRHAAEGRRDRLDRPGSDLVATGDQLGQLSNDLTPHLDVRLLAVEREPRLAVIAARRVVELNERARDNARAHYDYANQRFEGGLGSRLNALRAQQQLSTFERLLSSSVSASIPSPAVSTQYPSRAITRAI